LSIDLRTGLPRGLQVIHANNVAQRHGQYQVGRNERRPIDAAITNAKLLLVLSAQNQTVRSLRAFFNRSIAIWEGHTRERLDALVSAMTNHAGTTGMLAEALVEFLGEVAVGFSPSAFGDAFLAEVASKCSAPRKGKAAIIQGLARLLLDSPDHRGVAAALNRIDGLIRTDPAFKCIKIDHAREFREAIRLSEFDEPEAGLAEMSRRRTYAHPCPPARAISTVHKAKGLECDHVLLLPCDGQHFTDSDHHRCLLYVALSRAKRTLTLVVPRANPSPLIAT
jgi:DNA helicase-2/ATP-dependent DNA helicase PcrA